MAMELPEWVQYAAGALGVALAAFAAKMGLSSSPATTTPVEVAGALIDQKASKEITDALSASIRQYVDCHEEAVAIDREFLLRMEVFTEELRELRKEMRELTREVGRSRST